METFRRRRVFTLHYYLPNAEISKCGPGLILDKFPSYLIFSFFLKVSIEKDSPPIILLSVGEPRVEKDRDMLRFLVLAMAEIGCRRLRTT